MNFVIYRAFQDGTVAIGYPGLWKNSSRSPRAMFVLPSELLRGLVDREQIETWVEATRQGGCPEQWTAPPEDEIATLLNEEALTLRHETTLRRIEVLRDGEFSLRLPLAELDPELSAARRNWIETVLREAAASWPLVRFGLNAEGSAAIAEVNLTGASPEILTALVQPAMESFRWIVAGLVETLEFLASPEESGVLELFQPAA